MTAHKAAASLLAAGPDMLLVGMNPAVNTLQDLIQRNTATLTHTYPVLTDAASSPCSEILTHVETSQPQTEVLRPLKECGNACPTFRNGYYAQQRPASFPQDSSHDCEFKRNHSAATKGVISAEERDYRRSTSLSDEVKFLQPIFCCPQKIWRLMTNIGFTPF